MANLIFLTAEFPDGQRVDARFRPPRCHLSNLFLYSLALDILRIPFCHDEELLSQDEIGG